MARRLPLAALALQAGKAARCAAVFSLHFTDSDMDSDLPARRPTQFAAPDRENVTTSAKSSLLWLLDTCRAPIPRDVRHRRDSPLQWSLPLRLSRLCLTSLVMCLFSPAVPAGRPITTNLKSESKVHQGRELISLIKKVRERVVVFNTLRLCNCSESFRPK